MEEPIKTKQREIENNNKIINDNKNVILQTFFSKNKVEEISVPKEKIKTFEKAILTKEKKQLNHINWTQITD